MWRLNWVHREASLSGLTQNPAGHVPTAALSVSSFAICWALGVQMSFRKGAMARLQAAAAALQG